MRRIPERKGLTMKLKHYGAMLVNFVIAYANGDMSRREFDLNYSGYVVDFFPQFEQEHPLLARRFADTIDRTYDDCSCMPDDQFQDAISAAVDKFMGKMSETDLY